ncbi:hypothetical protein SOPP22_19345 [Shewanella sp. OPT22]|nr:hypothetical protein SOPP22_19345 [Shewanella sp. OPT22]
MAKFKKIVQFLCVSFIPLVIVFPTKAQNHSEHSNKQQLSTYLRMRFDLSGEPVITWWNGKVFAKTPNKKLRPIMGFEGFNIGKLVLLKNGKYRWQSREITYYTDLNTHKILTYWVNPYSGVKNQVLTSAIDPVNNDNFETVRANFLSNGDGYLLLNQDVITDKLNPVSPSEFPKASTGKRYLASEHFDYSVSQQDVDSNLSSIPYRETWLRTSSWFPWMEMGRKQGGLLLIGNSGKYNSISELPENILDYTQLNYPKFLNVPEQYKVPNEDSWTYYRNWKRKHRNG